MNDQTYLARALRLAEKGIYTTHPNPRVGCVLVRGGRIVGEGYHLKAGDEHAEAMALRNAGVSARGATAYVTLEPCSFQGRTPSCARALVEAGVERVVAAMEDPDPENSGAGFRILNDAGIEVVTPMLVSSAKRLNPGHIKRHESGIPFVRLKLAMTLDGKTALANGESRWITGVDARRDVQRLRAQSSAIVTGVQTIVDDDPRMNVRATELDHEHAQLAAVVQRKLYVLDSHCRIPTGSVVLSDPNTVIVCTRPPENKYPAPVEIIDPGEDGRVDLRAFLGFLGASDCNEVLFECGATLAGALVQQGLCDEIVIYVAPYFMGNDARSLLNLPEIGKMVNLHHLEIADIRMVGRDFRLTVRPDSHQT